ncbi:MAG: integration host factor subunit alpha [Rhodospirillaceae bacterium]
MTRTMTRAQLSESIYQEVGLSRNESAELLEMVLAEISTALVHDETVKISSFGSFSVRQKGERIGRNPKTGDEVPILPRKVLVFRPSQLLKARIRGEDVSGMTDEDEDAPALQQPPVGPAGFSSSET